MEKCLPLIEKCSFKGFLVLHFQLMVSLVGLAQVVAIDTSSESPNPFAGQNLNFTNPLLPMSQPVGRLIDCDKAGPAKSMHGWYSYHRPKRVTTTLPAIVSPESKINNCCVSGEFIDNKFN